MLKILITLILIGYIFYKITSFIFFGIFRRATQNRQHFRYPYKTRNGSVIIDTTSKGESKNSKKNHESEYIDYEEVE